MDGKMNQKKKGRKEGKNRGGQKERKGRERKGVQYLDKGGQKIDTYSYKINKLWAFNMQHGDYS